MRRMSKKYAARVEECREFRRKLIKRRGSCDTCGREAGPGEHPYLECHEIARGPLRYRALDLAYAILVVCRACHAEIHRASWTETEQLQVLKLSCPDDYDLAAYNNLVNPDAPNRITEEEVDDA